MYQPILVDLVSLSHPLWVGDQSYLCQEQGSRAVGAFEHKRPLLHPEGQQAKVQRQPIHSRGVAWSTGANLRQKNPNRARALHRYRVPRNHIDPATLHPQLCDAALSSYLGLRQTSLTPQCALAPAVEQAKEQDCKKYAHIKQGNQTLLAIDDRPWVHEGHFHIE